MSIEYKLFLRKKPRLDVTAIGAMALDLVEYVPRVGDPLEHVPWRDSIRWVIEAYGHITDYDEWLAFVARICTRYGGALWSEATSEFEPVDAYAGSDDDDEEAEQRRDAIEHAAFKRLVARAANSPDAMQALRSEAASNSDAFRLYFSRLLVDLAREGAPLDPWRWALRHLQDLRRISAMQTPRSRAALAKKGPLAATLVERFEAAQAHAAERKQRAEAAARVKAATKRRGEITRWLAEPDVDPPLIERRRRGGELLAGIPRSTTALLAQGKLDEAVAEYAKRYGLSREVARKVVSRHAPEITEAFTYAASVTSAPTAARRGRDDEG